MLRKIDLVLRFIYVALVPAILGLFAQFMSVMGLVITTGLATGIALAGTEGWRQRVGHIPIFFHRFPIVGFEAQMRVKERTRASPTRAKAAMTAALEAAVSSFIKSSDAELALELARDKLTELYRRDESHGFYLVRVDRTFAIFAKFQRTKAPVAWLAVTIVAPAKPGLHSTLQFVDDPAQLPAVLREILTL